MSRGDGLGGEVLLAGWDESSQDGGGRTDPLREVETGSAAAPVMVLGGREQWNGLTMAWEGWE